MNALNAHERQLAGLARGLRAAIVLPPLFALALFVIKQPEMAGLAVFGTFAHLVMVDYHPARETRSLESGALTALGAVVIGVGALASTDIWLAVGGAAIVGFLAEWRWFARGAIGVIRPALLMAFMLAVAVPTSPSALRPLLCGWLLAGLLAQLALQLLWIPIQPLHAARAVPLAQLAANSSTTLGNAICAGTAMGFAVLAARLLRLDHAFWVVLGVAPVLNMWNKSPAGVFWRQQAGTLLGFLAGAALVAGAGTHQAWYWIALPCTIFLAAYLSSAMGFLAGQAGFTAFAVVLFCILTPLQRQVGLLRVEDIAIGGAIGLLVGFLQRLGCYFKERPRFQS
jgi:hypothetical protein